MKLTELWIYPVKSCGGVSLQSMDITTNGPKGDREWMWVETTTGQFITQRQFPKMALVKVNLQPDFLGINLLQESFQVPRGSSKKPLQEVQVWGHRVQAEVEVGAWNAAMSDFLENSVQLVHFSKSSPRPKPVQFADSEPFHLISEESVKQLQLWQQPVSSRNFRPNLVVQSGQEAFAEDQWGQIKIGSMEFVKEKLTDRCVIINLDPKKGEVKSTGILKTLAQHRKQGKGIPFGIHLRTRAEGELKLGDQLSLS